MRIQGLPLLGVRDLDEVPVVFHHEIAPGELLGGDHAPAFAVNEVNLLGGDEREGQFLTARDAVVPGRLRRPGDYPRLNSFLEVCCRVQFQVY